MAKELTCLDHLPTEARDRMWARLEQGRAKWITRLRELLDSSTEEGRQLRELAGLYEGVVPRKVDDPMLSAASGWSGRLLYDLPELFKRAGRDPRTEMRELGRQYFEFTRQLCQHQHAAAMVKFVERLGADVNTIARGRMANPLSKHAGLSKDERRRAVWQEEVKPRLTGQLLGEMVWDDLPDKQTLEAVRLKAKKSRPPSPAAYWKARMEIMKRTGLRRRKRAYWARHLITEEGLDLDAEWKETWDHLMEQEVEEAGQEEEAIAEIPANYLQWLEGEEP